MPIAYRFRRLTMCPLAIGGAEGTGEGVAGTMERAEADVQGVFLADRGHWVAEQAPEELLAASTAFVARTATGERQGVSEGGRRRRPSTASVTVIEDTSIRPEVDPDV